MFRKFVCSSVSLGMIFGASLYAGQNAEKSCGDQCRFIRNVVKEEPTGFAKFRGKAKADDSDGDKNWEGTYTLPISICTLKNSHNRSSYACDLYISEQAMQTQPNYNGSKEFPKDIARKKYADLVEALKSALPDGWQFKETKADPGTYGPFDFYTRYITEATQGKTNAKIDIQLLWNGSEEKADSAYLGFSFSQPGAE